MRYAILMSILIMMTMPTATADEEEQLCDFGRPIVSDNDQLLDGPDLPNMQIKIGAWINKPDGSSGRGVEWMILDCSSYICVINAASLDDVRECLGMAKDAVDEYVGNTSIEEPGLPPNAIRLDTLHYVVPGETPGEGGLFLEDDYWLSDETLDMLGLFAIADAVLTGTPCGSEDRPAFCAD